MAEENKEKSNWTTYLAITTVLIAVCATLHVTVSSGLYFVISVLNISKLKI